MSRKTYTNLPVPPTLLARIREAFQLSNDIHQHSLSKLLSQSRKLSLNYRSYLITSLGQHKDDETRFNY